MRYRTLPKSKSHLWSLVRRIRVFSFNPEDTVVHDEDKEGELQGFLEDQDESDSTREQVKGGQGSDQSVQRAELERESPHNRQEEQDPVTRCPAEGGPEEDQRSQEGKGQENRLESAGRDEHGSSPRQL